MDPLGISKWLIAVASMACTATAFGQAEMPDLATVSAAHGWKGATSAFTFGERNGRGVLECNQTGQHVIWLDGREFEQATLEFDAKGSSRPQSSFIGVTFRVESANVFDAVYFRPFNFRAETLDRRSRSIQYISEPSWPWQRLRAERGGQFEGASVPAPDGDDWFHAKVSIDRENRVRVWVNGSARPSLEVNALSGRKAGGVGLVCIGHGGISKLKITSHTSASE